MVGPGTGVAPFSRVLAGAQDDRSKRKNWLFFGRSTKIDFAYGEEFEGFKKEGLLTRLDGAWSRDQAEKIYVQHVMKDNAAEIGNGSTARAPTFRVRRREANGRRMSMRRCEKSCRSGAVKVLIKPMNT